MNSPILDVFGWNVMASLPMHGLSKIYVKSVKCGGSMIDFDENSINGKSFSIAKILIDTQIRHFIKRNTYMVREHHVTVLPANHVNVLCMGLCVSGGSYVQYTYMIGLGAQPRGAPGPCKYFSFIKGWIFLAMGEGGCEVFVKECGSVIASRSSFHSKYIELVEVAPTAWPSPSHAGRHAKEGDRKTQFGKSTEKLRKSVCDV